MHSWHPSLSCPGSSGKTTVLYSLNQSCITKVISKGWAWVDAGNKKLWNLNLLAVSPQVKLLFYHISSTIGLPLFGMQAHSPLQTDFLLNTNPVLITLAK